MIQKWFLSPEKLFKKKLKKYNFETMEDFIQMVFSPLEWRLDKKGQMKVHPFPSDTNTTLYFYRKFHPYDHQFIGYGFLIREKKRNIYCFSSERFYNNIDNSSNNFTHKKRYEDIHEHLKNTLEHLEITKRKKESEMKEQHKKEEKERVEKKRRELQFALSSQNLWSKKTYKDFHLQSFVSTGRHYLSLFISGIPVFHATFTYGRYTYEFINKDTKEYAPVIGFEEYIVSYFHKKLKPEKGSLLNPSTVEKLKYNIEQKLKDLEGSIRWLTPETKHVVTITYPHDLKELFSIYDEVSKPKQVKEDMVSSLETIMKSLEKIESEVENKKAEEISKRKKIIEAR